MWILLHDDLAEAIAGKNADEGGDDDDDYEEQASPRSED